MNHPTRRPSSTDPGWTLEVVRGAHVGRTYPVDAGDLILGSNPTAEAGARVLNLADQEGASPRKMAASHASLSWSAGLGFLKLRDLESPGGTFVANRRVLPGTGLALLGGEVIQLGAVQLRVTRAAPGPAPAPPSPSPAPAAPFRYETAASGTVCRNWDDFLAVSAQRWDELRADLISGRLEAFVRSVGRPDLAPPPCPAKTLHPDLIDDERLDAWIALLPTASPAAPELDVHPSRVTIAIPAPGVTVARKVRVSNVGHRLLKVRVTVEHEVGARFAVGPSVLGRELVVREAVDVPFEVAVPDPFVGPAAATLLIRGGGQERRIAIEVTRKAAPSTLDPADPDIRPTPPPIPGPIAAFLALRISKRVAIAAPAGVVVRLLVGVAGGAIGEDAMIAAGPDVPHLGGVALAFAAAGAGWVGWLVVRRSGPADLPAGAVAGAGLGVLVAAGTVAACRAIEPALGARAASPLVVCAVWGLIAAGLASLTAFLPRTPTEEPAR